MTEPEVDTSTPAEDNSHAGQGSVTLDIGGDIGALIVTMPAALEGVEVEIRPVGATGPRNGHSHSDHDVNDHHHDHDHDHGHSHTWSPWPHVAVVARPTPNGIVHSLVYGEVVEGRYELYIRPAEPVALVAEVRGGEVTEAVWPDA